MAIERLLVAGVLTVLLGAAACAPAPDPVVEESEYAEEIAAWKAEREEELRLEDGWLSLVGLFWLEEGENTFGSDPVNDLVFPDGTRPRLGVLRLEDGVVTLETEPGAGIELGGVEVSTIELASDLEDEPTVLELGSLRFHLIDRAGRLGIRVKDTESPALAAFAGMDYFPVDPSWRIVASFEAFDQPEMIEVPNVLGSSFAEPAPGIAWFERDGRRWALTPIAEPGEPLFFVFGDETNGGETYGGGRFLSAPPAANGTVVLDFNRAYNPPCVFTPYATCPLPPPQNKLALAIQAGEKTWGAAGH